MRNRVTSRAMLLSMATFGTPLAGAAQSDPASDTVVVTGGGSRSDINIRGMAAKYTLGTG